MPCGIRKGESVMDNKELNAAVNQLVELMDPLAFQDIRTI